GDAAACRVDQAALWGLGRVIALEHPDLWGGLVDLDPTASPDEAERLAREVYEATGGPAAEQVAWRQDQRFTARLQASSLPASRTRFAADPNGTYLITGGLGGLGLKVAQWLVMQGAGGLVLVGRQGTVPEKMRPVVAQWQQAGVSVTVEALDVSDRRAVEACIAGIAARGHTLRGVVHAAGVLEDAMLMKQTWQGFEKAFAPKVKGAWNLHQATAGLELHLFVLFSSVAAVLGLPGQSNYAAANAALDALAHHRRARNLAATSVNWGQWSDVGMAADSLGRHVSAWTQRGLGLIHPPQGITALGQALEARFPVVAISPVEWPKLADAMMRPPVMAELAKAAGQARTTHVQGTLLIHELAALPPAERRARLGQIVSGVVCKVLGLPAKTTLQPRQALKDLGLDSMLAITLRNTLGTELGHPMPATLAFDYPTLETLTKFLEGELPFGEAGQIGQSDEANKSEELREVFGLLTQIESQYSKAEVEKLLASLA
ncbi:MAG TPA: beta-ketoacyl reductase, partial [Myxococcota bacterium]|nr:beta-ketoacyl reductase [Myxococcota bacterium]